MHGKPKPAIFTIGHSTRTQDSFISILQENGITLLVDVRTIPRSRRNPQFNMESLPAPLKKAGIRYLHMPELGGLRHALKDSPNAGWRNASFRGFADYMQTPDFEKSVSSLIALSNKEKIAIMCAEAVPWRCHRSLISDALTVHGIRVEHIMGPGSLRPHELTPFASVRGTRITYPEAK